MKKGMNKEMIIKNGQIFIEQRGTFEALDIRIESEKIVEIGKKSAGRRSLRCKRLFYNTRAH